MSTSIFMYHFAQQTIILFCLLLCILSIAILSIIVYYNINKETNESEGSSMKRTGLFITWMSGSKNGNAIQEFKRNGINWEYNHFGELTADFYGIGTFEKVDFEHVEGNVYEICRA